MKKQILAAVLTIALTGSINLTGCQKAESVEGISPENTSSVSLTAESDNSQPEEDREEASSSDSEDGNTSPQPDLSVDEEGNVIDNHTGEAAEGYEVNSNGDVAGSSTGAGVAPEKEVTPTPAPQTSSIAGKPASPNTTSKPGTEANPIETPENTPSPGAGNTGGTATSTKPAPLASSKPGTPASGKPSETKPSHTHSYTAKTVAATCMAGGYTLHTCSCGKNYKDNQTTALGHSYGAWTVVKEATTTSEGSQTRTCSRCGVKETQSIPKVADKYSAYAAPSNANLIEERVLYYINQYRAAQGSAKATSLPNLKAYAKYRSKQLVSNFAHSATDERAAAAAMKYGDYIDPSTWGADREAYWQPPCTEAIGYTNYYFQSDTIDDVAKRLADGVRDSAGHWRYVGLDGNNYISIGITEGNGNFYCDISITNTNIYG